MENQIGVGIKKTILILSILFGLITYASLAPSLARAAGGCQGGAAVPCGGSSPSSL